MALAGPAENGIDAALLLLVGHLAVVPLAEDLVLLLERTTLQPLGVDRLDGLALGGVEFGERFGELGLVVGGAGAWSAGGGGGRGGGSVLLKRRVARSCQLDGSGVLCFLVGGGGFGAGGGDTSLAALEADLALGDLEVLAGGEGKELVNAGVVLWRGRGSARARREVRNRATHPQQDVSETFAQSTASIPDDPHSLNPSLESRRSLLPHQRRLDSDSNVLLGLGKVETSNEDGPPCLDGGNGVGRSLVGNGDLGVGLRSHLSRSEEGGGRARADVVGAEHVAFEGGAVGGVDEDLEDIGVGEGGEGFGKRFEDEVGVASLLALVELSANEGDSALLSVGESSLPVVRRGGLLGFLLLLTESSTNSTLVGILSSPPLLRALATTSAGLDRDLLASFGVGGGGLATEDGGGESEGTEADRIALEGRAVGEEEVENGGRGEDVTDEGFLHGL